jgi:hypothetical protein
MLLPLFVSLLEEGYSFFLVMLASEHHLVENDQNTVSYGNGGPLLPAPLPDLSIVFSKTPSGSDLLREQPGSTPLATTDSLCECARLRRLPALSC